MGAKSGARIANLQSDARLTDGPSSSYQTTSRLPAGGDASTWHATTRWRTHYPILRVGLAGPGPVAAHVSAVVAASFWRCVSPSG
jgi:hypothetical protein